MAERKIAKAASLVAGIAMICVMLSGQQDWHAVGIYRGCPLSSRLLYPFFHASWLHLCLNVWCLWGIVFIYDIGIWRLLLAYLASVAMPVNILCGMDTPTIGLSGVVFFLFGSVSFEVLRKWYWQAWMISYLVLGFCFPNTNAWLHLYCYVAGLAFAVLNKPIRIITH